jgi:hypothetical protein
MYYYAIVTGILVIWLILYFTIKVRINVPVGIVVYGLARTVGYNVYRTVRNVYGYYEIWRHGRPQRLPERPRRAESVLEINSAHRLDDPFDVVLGYDGMRVIKVNLRRHHTIIGSTTGAGKTNLINSLLIQLFGRGSVFTSACDVYLIDLKNDEFDYLSMWIPLLAGYATIDSTGIGPAVDLLSGLVGHMETGRHDKHTILIIDEMAFLTAMATDKDQERLARMLLRRIMSQYRTWGTVIGAVQHAKYDIVPTEIRVNMDRKVALKVESKDHAKTILGYRPEKHELPWEPGQFLLNEPGRRELVSGKCLLVQVPQEIEAIIGNNIESSLLNWQEEFFYDMAKGLVPGGPTPGIVKLSKATPYTQTEIQTAKRHFALAGALTPPDEGGGQAYLLAEELPLAIGMVRNYVRMGRWTDVPPAFVKQTNGKSDA